MRHHVALLRAKDLVGPRLEFDGKLSLSYAFEYRLRSCFSFGQFSQYSCCFEVTRAFSKPCFFCSQVRQHLEFALFCLILEVALGIPIFSSSSSCICFFYSHGSFQSQNRQKHPLVAAHSLDSVLRSELADSFRQARVYVGLKGTLL